MKMTQQILTETEKELELLKNEVVKGTLELEKDKLEFIQQIKQFKRDEILNQQPKKQSLWTRIKKVLSI